MLMNKRRLGQQTAPFLHKTSSAPDSETTSLVQQILTQHTPFAIMPAITVPETSPIFSGERGRDSLRGWQAEAQRWASANQS